MSIDASNGAVTTLVKANTKNVKAKGIDRKEIQKSISSQVTLLFKLSKDELAELDKHKLELVIEE